MFFRIIFTPNPKTYKFLQLDSLPTFRSHSHYIFWQLMRQARLVSEKVCLILRNCCYLMPCQMWKVDSSIFSRFLLFL